MTPQFYGLDDRDYQELINSISLITVLIAGADGDIDPKETEWAEKVTSIRSYSLPDGLKDFYQDVGTDFQERLDLFIDRYEGDTENRNRKISEVLAGLNLVFPKIKNREVAVSLYESLVSFAEHVAKASGGFLNWGAINSQEKKLISLSMIHPVEE